MFCGRLVSLILVSQITIQLFTLRIKYCVWQYTNTKSLAKEFSEILIYEYFGYLRMVSDVFFDADSESPHMT